MITPLMWIGVLFGAAALLYVAGRIFVDGGQSPKHLAYHQPLALVLWFNAVVAGLVLLQRLAGKGK